MTHKILIANWKMNVVQPELYFQAFTEALTQNTLACVQVGFTVPYTLLTTVRSSSPSTCFVYAQNVHERESGAFTGEISWPLLESLAITGSLLGHSERRQFFQESDALVAQKLALTRKRGHHAVVCIGETQQQRERGETFSILTSQLTPLLPFLSKETCLLAYEPVWAIGTGLSATPQQAQEVHGWIQDFLHTHQGTPRGSLPLLYGGSANAANLAALLQQPDIDGALVGGASLQPLEFANMANIAALATH